MGKINMEQKNELKLNIVETISQYTHLEKKGNYYWGCCPFHMDLKPSMSVNPTKATFKCFACGINGDVIKFLAKIQNKSRKDILEGFKV